MRIITFSSFREQQAWREQGLGASEAPSVMGASKWTTAKELWELRTGRKPPRPQNPAMRRGLDLEALAREEYEQLSGIAMPAVFGEHDKHPYIHASFDGLNELHRRVTEIKCPGREDHKTARLGRVPKHYIWQCVQQLAICEYDVLDYFSFDGLRGTVVRFFRDLKMEKTLLTEVAKMWKSIVTNKTPVSVTTALARKVLGAGSGIFSVRSAR